MALWALAACSRSGAGSESESPQPAPVAVGARALLPPLYADPAGDPACPAPFRHFYRYRPAREGDLRALTAVVWLDGTVVPEEPVRTPGEARAQRARCISPDARGGPAAETWCCR